MPTRRAVAAALTAGAAIGWRLAEAQPIEPPDPFGPEGPTPLASRALEMMDGDPRVRSAAIEFFRRRGDADAIPALTQALRFTRRGENELFDALSALAGGNAGDSWFAWQRWIEANADLRGFDGFVGFKASVFSEIDRDFLLFLHEGVAHDIRIEEVVWGNARKDGIPALTAPEIVAAAAVDDLAPDELVFGVALGGEARAYPLKILEWHELTNDVVGGRAVSLAYCTLCGAGVLYDAAVAGRDAPFEFGNSGLLYRSNKLMYDTATHSLWNQFTGRPVVGALTGSRLQLEALPLAVARWGDWRDAHPDTGVLSSDTGYDRDYDAGPYARYYASDALLFPALIDDDRLEPKDFVFALRGSEAAAGVAWPLTAFDGGAAINDQIGFLSVTLIGDADSRTVRAYRTDGRIFVLEADGALTDGDGERWRIGEDALLGPSGERFERLAGHVAYWFAWSGFVADGTAELRDGGP